MTTNENTRVVDGRHVINRAWIADHAGVSAHIVKYWFRTAKADTNPPAGVATLDRVQYCDRRTSRTSSNRGQRPSGHLSPPPIPNSSRAPTTT
ncbi:hypothetical protein [Streptomyces sp. 3N207]|uniref:hypothetical protein n=1 Tax=Streptomyces sp. 3N207 TaxID=3457417 RepID=UPI003FD2440F